MYIAFQTVAIIYLLVFTLSNCNTNLHVEYPWNFWTWMYNTYYYYAHIVIERKQL